MPAVTRAHETQDDTSSLCGGRGRKQSGPCPTRSGQQFSTSPQALLGLRYVGLAPSCWILCLLISSVVSMAHDVMAGKKLLESASYWENRGWLANPVSPGMPFT